jgi:hypothetical protein
MSGSSIEELCSRYLGGLPSPPVLALMKKVENERSEVRAFVERMFRLMNLYHFDPKDIPPTLASMLAGALPGILPGAWGGMVPPVTFEERHQAINKYLCRNSWANLGAGSVLLEMGCGFPPQTAIDAANFLPDWQIVGADPCFDQYVLYDPEGNYACLDINGRIRYFQGARPDPAAFLALIRDREVTLRRFASLFESLVSKLPKGVEERAVTVEHAGSRLVQNPLKLYERANLKLMQAGIGSELPPAHVVRCFNVLPYFDSEFRRNAEDWALRTLHPGGLFVCGADGLKTMDARYSVYRSEGGRLVAKELAFTLDHVRPITLPPWFSMHDGERETWSVARLVGTLRSDEDFRRVYDQRLDALLGEKRMLQRQADGCFTTPPDPLPFADWPDARLEINARLDAEGFVDRAVSALQKAGFHSWRNPVGHIAVDPAEV